MPSQKNPSSLPTIHTLIATYKYWKTVELDDICMSHRMIPTPPPPGPFTGHI